ncbi:helix-turn-helix transcriptional regulator [uncultured Modestobacter sp.]|uniref:LuxR family transcriptional regulator n=1 Tax=uncultured Modestobacter sp. TaxID=380048 RepID=UPI002624835E|nr:helix-turn-helix transcriptional regulator [uncultured Modestobacter sp.]
MDRSVDPGALPTWPDLLAVIARGEQRLVLETPSGERAVLLAESELLALEAAVRAAGGHPDQEPRLTARETQVLELVAGGRTGADIAEELGLATNTVAQHLVAVRRKFNVQSSAAAVAAARRAGLLPTPQDR